MNINETALNLWFMRSTIIMVVSFIFIMLSMGYMIYSGSRLRTCRTGLGFLLTTIASTVCSVSGLVFLVTGVIKLLLSVGIIK